MLNLTRRFIQDLLHNLVQLETVILGRLLLNLPDLSLVLLLSALVLRCVRDVYIVNHYTLIMRLVIAEIVLSIKLSNLRPLTCQVWCIKCVKVCHFAVTLGRRRIRTWLLTFGILTPIDLSMFYNEQYYRYLLLVFGAYFAPTIGAPPLLFFRRWLWLTVPLLSRLCLMKFWSKMLGLFLVLYFFSCVARNSTMESFFFSASSFSESLKLGTSYVPVDLPLFGATMYIMFFT